MPSPFPGMDPYLEGTGFWPDFHQRLATTASDVLNARLPAPYYATMQYRAELSVAADETTASDRDPEVIVPDLIVLKHHYEPAAADSGAVALAEPETEVATYVEFDTVSGDTLRHTFIEIRDAKQNHKLITLIEILSPANKRPGPDRETYRAKQAEILESDVNLVEIDLLRRGQRVIATPEIAEQIARLSPPPEYAVLVSRARRRKPPMLGYGMYPIFLRRKLPSIAIPLAKGDRDVMLDLQDAFNRAYDNGPYRRGAINYNKPPDVPLPDELAAWAKDRIAAAFSRA